ncbi:MAG: hypothetical protein EOO73_30450 [Myxococcales bacterium]|nr:MAG: hypothetical protein EOO73_30450 [Myxococcales bacterium]
MLESSDDSMSIVVLEAGAAWPGWLAEYQRLAPNSVVIAQASAESPQSFQARVLSRVAEARARSDAAHVRIGVLVAAHDPEQKRAELRRRVARSLVEAMSPASAHDRELVLAGDSDDLNQSRHELFALAGTLCDELRGKRINVRVRFTSAHSGVMRTVTPSSPDLQELASKR